MAPRLYVYHYLKDFYTRAACAGEMDSLLDLLHANLDIVSSKTCFLCSFRINDMNPLPLNNSCVGSLNGMNEMSTLQIC